MSLVWDTRSIEVDGGSAIDVDLNVATVEINAALPVAEVSVTVPNTTTSVQVDVPGIQGPPGVRNVYIQPNDPAVEFGWGPEETNYVWIPTP